jgi:hypothetical protein
MFLTLVASTLATRGRGYGVGRPPSGRASRTNLRYSPAQEGLPAFTPRAHSDGSIELKIDKSMMAKAGVGQAPEQFYGFFSFSLAAALQGHAALTVQQLAEKIVDLYRTSKREPSVVFEATDPEALILPSRKPVTADRRGIDILEPRPEYGTALVHTSNATIEGRIVPAGEVVAVLVNNVAASVRRDGRFRAKVPLELGPNRVFVIAFFRDQSFDHADLTLTYTDEGTLAEPQ